MNEKMIKEERVKYEREWCVYELEWINCGGFSEYSADYLTGFIAALDFIKELDEVKAYV